ncbi:MAG: hypothetical protein CBC09_01670 [Cellvibrionales bacterium TMED49]|nr:hypothetical protein [Porticoccaceae bacterium]OUU39575.1 MAG: hypothetical protein CBC09_01670 [Cellvibrionales bacterium TMED49]
MMIWWSFPLNAIYAIDFTLSTHINRLLMGMRIGSQQKDFQLGKIQIIILTNFLTSLRSAPCISLGSWFLTIKYSSSLGLKIVALKKCFSLSLIYSYNYSA